MKYKVLALTLALLCIGLVGCGESNNNSTLESQSINTTASSTKTSTINNDGHVTFTFTVVSSSGEESSYNLTTACSTLYEALYALRYVEGTADEDSFTINYVMSESVDAKHHWAFYINGELATTTVNETTPEEGAVYLFQIEEN